MGGQPIVMFCSFFDTPAPDVDRPVFKLGIISRCCLLADPADSQGKKKQARKEHAQTVMLKS